MNETSLTINIYKNMAQRAFCEVCKLKKECQYASLADYPNLIAYRRIVKEQVHAYKKTEALTKVCTVCGEEKRISEFGRNRHKKDGLQAFCRECARERSKRARQKRRQNRNIRTQSATTAKYETTEERAYAIINARRQYYDPSYQYLLKKYLRRHKKQLELWIKKEKIFTDALLEEGDSEIKKRLRNRLSTVQYKIKSIKT